MNALSNQAIRVLKLFGKDVDYVSTTVGLVVFLFNKKVLLLGADGGGDVVHILAEQLQDADGLTGQCLSLIHICWF